MIRPSILFSATGCVNFGPVPAMAPRRAPRSTPIPVRGKRVYHDWKHLGRASGAALRPRVVGPDPGALADGHRLVRRVQRRSAVRLRLPVPDAAVSVARHQYSADAAAYLAVRRSRLLRICRAGFGDAPCRWRLPVRDALAAPPSRLHGSLGLPVAVLADIPPSRRIRAEHLRPGADRAGGQCSRLRVLADQQERRLRRIRCHRRAVLGPDRVGPAYLSAGF